MHDLSLLAISTSKNYNSQKQNWRELHIYLKVIIIERQSYYYNLTWPAKAEVLPLHKEA